VPIAPDAQRVGCWSPCRLGRTTPSECPTVTFPTATAARPGASGQSATLTAVIPAQCSNGRFVGDRRICARTSPRRKTSAMNRRRQGPKTGAKAARAPKVIKHRARSIKSTKQGRGGGDLEKMLLLIRAHPGIRPSELNRRLNRDQSDALRNTLIKRGLIRKEKDGSAMRYYPVDR
jgi:hypothetical protein